MQIIEDPIAVPITKLEQDIHGNPKEFNQVLEKMVKGEEGEIRITNARRLLPKVSAPARSNMTATFDRLHFFSS